MTYFRIFCQKQNIARFGNKNKQEFILYSSQLTLYLQHALL